MPSANALRVGILATGITPKELIGQHGAYSDMFVALFNGINRPYRYQVFAVRDGQFPDSATVCDAWIITGSAANVDEDRGWMQQLKRLILEIDVAGRPMLGICFGHQIIAEAFGGRVERFEGGWGAGLHVYDVVSQPGSRNKMPDKIRLSAMHRYQVTAKPEGATVVAHSEFCQFAALAYGPKILTFQAHPEFSLAFEAKLLELRDGSAIPTDCAQAARASMQAPGAATDSPLVASVMAEVLERA